MTCGDYHTVGVNREGDLVSWGWSHKGQLGHGNNRDVKTEPEIIDNALFPKQVEHVACGSVNTFILTTDGELYSW